MRNQHGVVSPWKPPRGKLHARRARATTGATTGATNLFKTVPYLARKTQYEQMMMHTSYYFTIGRLSFGHATWAIQQWLYFQDMVGVGSGSCNRECKCILNDRFRLSVFRCGRMQCSSFPFFPDRKSTRLNNFREWGLLRFV